MNRKISIFLGEVVAFGGAERSCLALSKWLSSIGLANELVTYRDIAGLDRHISWGADVVQLLPGPDPLRKIVALRKYYAKYSASFSDVPLMSSYQPALHATAAGLKIFHCLMHDTPSLMSGYKNQSLLKKLRTKTSNKIIEIGLSRGGQTIVTSSYLQKESYREFHVNASIARMGGLYHPALDNPRRFNGESINLLSVSRLEPNKRIDWIIDSVAKLTKHSTLGKYIRLHIVGDGSLRDELKKKVKMLRIESTVRFYGFVPDDEVNRLYESSDIFIMPAVQGYGIPAVEALYRGMPVLLHRDSGVSDLLLNTPWAKVIGEGKESLTEGLEELLAAYMSGDIQLAARPQLPTESSWATNVGSLCGWVKQNDHI